MLNIRKNTVAGSGITMLTSSKYTVPVVGGSPPSMSNTISTLITFAGKVALTVPFIHCPVGEPEVINQDSL